MPWSPFPTKHRRLREAVKAEGLSFSADGDPLILQDHRGLDPIVQAAGEVTADKAVSGRYRDQPIQLTELRYRMPRVGIGRRERRVYQLAKLGFSVPKRGLKIHTDDSFNELPAIPRHEDLIVKLDASGGFLAVRTEDKSFAKELLHADLRRLLAENPGLHLEIDGGALFVYRSGELDAETLSGLMDLALEIMRQMTPGYGLPVSSLAPILCLF